MAIFHGASEMGAGCIRMASMVLSTISMCSGSFIVGNGVTIAASASINYYAFRCPSTSKILSLRLLKSH